VSAFALRVSNSDAFPMSLSGPAFPSGAMPATMTGGAAVATSVATTMPTAVSVATTMPAAVAAAIPAAVATTIPAAAATTIPAAAATTIPAAAATAFGVGDVVSNDEAAFAEFHGLGHPGAHDCDGQGRPGQPLGESAPRSDPVTRRFGFDLHGYFSWGVAQPF
jgi:hypothetical protein